LPTTSAPHREKANQAVPPWVIGLPMPQKIWCSPPNVLVRSTGAGGSGSR